MEQLHLSYVWSPAAQPGAICSLRQQPNHSEFLELSSFSANYRTQADFGGFKVNSLLCLNVSQQDFRVQSAAVQKNIQTECEVWCTVS